MCVTRREGSRGNGSPWCGRVLSVTVAAARGTSAKTCHLAGKAGAVTGWFGAEVAAPSPHLAIDRPEAASHPTEQTQSTKRLEGWDKHVCRCWVRIFFSPLMASPQP